VLFFALFGCNKIENVSPMPTENAKNSAARVEEKPFLLQYENLHPEIKVSFVRYNAEGDYLEFSDPYIFEKLKTELTNQSHQALSAWESQFEGFTSLRNIYEQALKSEEERVKISNLLFGEELPKDIKRDTSHTAFVNKHRDSFVFDKDGRYNMNIAFYNIAHFVNKHGIVKIANYFFQYTYNQIKILKSGNPSKLDLLKSASQNVINEIVILPILVTKNQSNASNGRVEETEASNNLSIYVGGFPYTCSSMGNMYYELNQNDYQVPIYTIIGYEYNYFLGQYIPIFQITGYENKTSITAYMQTTGCHFLHGWTPVSQYQKKITVEFTRCDTYYYTQFSSQNHTSTLSLTAYDGVRINKYSGTNPCFSNVTGRFENWAFVDNQYGQNYAIVSLRII
jgi:hypothetical protein